MNYEIVNIIVTIVYIISMAYFLNNDQKNIKKSNDKIRIFKIELEMLDGNENEFDKDTPETLAMRIKQYSQSGWVRNMTDFDRILNMIKQEFSYNNDPGRFILSGIGGTFLGLIISFCYVWWIGKGGLDDAQIVSRIVSAAAIALFTSIFGLIFNAWSNKLNVNNEKEFDIAQNRTIEYLMNNAKDVEMIIKETQFSINKITKDLHNMTNTIHPLIENMKDASESFNTSVIKFDEIKSANIESTNELKKSISHFNQLMSEFLNKYLIEKENIYNLISSSKKMSESFSAIALNDKKIVNKLETISIKMDETISISNRKNGEIIENIKNNLEDNQKTRNAILKQIEEQENQVSKFTKNTNQNMEDITNHITKSFDNSAKNMKIKFDGVIVSEKTENQEVMKKIIDHVNQIQREWIQQSQERNIGAIFLSIEKMIEQLIQNIGKTTKLLDGIKIDEDSIREIVMDENKKHSVWNKLNIFKKQEKN